MCVLRQLNERLRRFLSIDVVEFYFESFIDYMSFYVDGCLNVIKLIVKLLYIAQMYAWLQLGKYSKREGQQRDRPIDRSTMRKKVIIPATCNKQHPLCCGYKIDDKIGCKQDITRWILNLWYFLYDYIVCHNTWPRICLHINITMNITYFYFSFHLYKFRLYILSIKLN